jgi:hypothetical protein
LVVFRVSWEQWTAIKQLNEDTTDRPDINARVVVSAAEENVWGPVPQRNNLIGVVSYGDTKCPRESEIGQLKLPCVVDKQVLRLKVPMEYALTMTMRNSLHKLEQVCLGIHNVKSLPPTIMQNLVEVIIQILKHKCQLPLSMYNIT